MKKIKNILIASFILGMMSCNPIMISPLIVTDNPVGSKVGESSYRLNLLGSGVAGLMGGMGAAGTTIAEAPATAASSPLATALGTGLMGADIYGRIFGNKS